MEKSPPLSEVIKRVCSKIGKGDHFRLQVFHWGRRNSFKVLQAEVEPCGLGVAVSSQSTGVPLPRGNIDEDLIRMIGGPWSVDGDACGNYLLLRTNRS